MDRLARIKAVANDRRGPLASGIKGKQRERVAHFCLFGGAYREGDIERERLEEIIETSRAPIPRRRAKRIDEYDDVIPGLDDRISEGMKILHSDEEDD